MPTLERQYWSYAWRMPDRDPRTLPGLSARTLFRALAGFIVGGVGVLILAEPFLLIDKTVGAFNEATGIAVLITVGAALAVAFVAFLALYPQAVGKQRAELKVGYTTLTTQFDQVDGIDPSTGLVVRPAIRRLTPAMVGDAITTGLDIGPIDIGHGTVSIAARVRPAVIGFIASVIVMFAGSFWFVSLSTAHPEPSTGLVVGAFFLGFAGLCGVIIVPVFTLQYAPLYYSVAMLQRRAAGTRVFRADLSDSDIVIELVGVDVPSLPGARYVASCLVAFEATQLVLYRRTTRTLLPFLVIPRSRIIGSHLGWDANYNSGNTSPVLTILKDNGSHFDETLTLTPATLLGWRKQLKSQSNWVVDWANRAL